MQWASAFTGRTDELARLSQGVRDGSTTLVVGDPGIGKTRLAAECAAQFEAAGWLVVSAPCLPLAEQLPLLPVVDGLRQLLGVEQGALLQDCLQDCAPFVRDDLERLVPELAPGSMGAISGEWPRQRLFAAVLQCWTAVARRRPLLIIVEDLHWSDHATRDFLTYLSGQHVSGSVSVVLTARPADALDDGSLTAWSETAVATGRWQRIGLTPLTPSEVEAMAASVLPLPLTADQISALVRRADGNPFFVEQLLAASVVTTLSEELAELLRARAAAGTSEAQDVLRVLAVAGRPLSDDELATVTGQSASQVRGALRELVGGALARLSGDGLCAPRHALLGEAVEAGLFAGERADLHGAVAVLLINRREAALAAEAAHHLRLAGRPHDELPVRITAAEYCEQVGGLADASHHWSRVVELAEEFDDEHVAELALRGIRAAGPTGAAEDFLDEVERGKRAAERHGQRQLYAALSVWSARLSPVDGGKKVTEMQAAVDAFQGLPPSTDQVDALSSLYRVHRNQGTPAEAMPYLRLAVEIEKSLPANSTRALEMLAHAQLVDGEIESGLAALAAAWQRAGPDAEMEKVAHLGVLQTDTDLKLNRLAETATAGIAIWHRLQAHGWADSYLAAVVLGNVGEALRHAGEIDEMRRLVEPLTNDRMVGSASWILHEQRCWVDLCGGRLDDAVTRLDQILSRSSPWSLEELSEFGQLRLELAVWRGDPQAGLDIAVPILVNSAQAQTESWAARLLTSAAWACADLVDDAQARRDDMQVRAAVQLCEQLEAAHADLAQDPFAEHPYFVTATVEGLEWRAELSRSRMDNQPEAWLAVARQWEALGRPHRAGYAWWRAAQALLNLGRRGPAASALQRAYQLGGQHVPLTTAVTQLARISRVSLEPKSRPLATPNQVPAAVSPMLTLTARELDVLRLLTEGLTNAEIGARLYMSPKTASVHVTAILRKLQATNRVQAAAIAERLGLTSN